MDSHTHTHTQDFAKLIEMICRAFAECESVELDYEYYVNNKGRVDSGTVRTHPVMETLRELQLILRCYVPLMCLDRVSTGNAQNTNGTLRSSSSSSWFSDMAKSYDNADNISAHMNVMLTPMRFFLERIRLTRESTQQDALTLYPEQARTGLHNAMRNEQIQLCQNLQLLRSLYARRSMDQGLTNAIRENARALTEACTYELHMQSEQRDDAFNTRSIFKVLTLEGTGIYSPLDV